MFTARPDDFYLPTSLAGDDARKLQDAIDAFVSKDHTSTRFYLTSSNAPYSGGAFQIIKDARVTLAEGAATFGPGASRTSRTRWRGTSSRLARSPSWAS